MNKKIVTFVGPHGSGKSTQALLLLKSLRSLGLHVHLTNLGYNGFFQRYLGLFLMKISGSHKMRSKFYEDLPPEEHPSYELYKRLFFIVIGIHCLSFLLAQIKRGILTLFYEVIIEHEGYISKEIVELHYAVKIFGIDHGGLSGKVAKNLSAFFLNKMKQTSSVVIYLKIRPEALRSRFIARKSRIEPLDYVIFQKKMYEQFFSSFYSSSYGLLILDSEKAIDNINDYVVSFVRKNLSF